MYKCLFLFFALFLSQTMVGSSSSVCQSKPKKRKSSALYATAELSLPKNFKQLSTKEQKEAKRQLRCKKNRAYALRSRQRKRERLKYLEEQVAILRARVEKLEEENTELRKHIEDEDKRRERESAADQNVSVDLFFNSSPQLFSEEHPPPLAPSSDLDEPY